MGLIASVAMSGADFASKAPTLFARAPVIALFVDPPFDTAALFQTPALQQIIDLAFAKGEGVNDELAIAIARSSHARNVRELYLRHGSITSRGLDALAKSPYLENLISVDLTGNPCASRVTQIEGDLTIPSAGEPYLASARDRAFVSSDPMVLQWPPLFDHYAWID